jgi:hypothetical protein
MRCDTESLFLLGFSDEEFLAALVMASSGAFFNKLLVALPNIEIQKIPVVDYRANKDPPIPARSASPAAVPTPIPSRPLPGSRYRPFRNRPVASSMVLSSGVAVCPVEKHV